MCPPTVIVICNWPDRPNGVGSPNKPDSLEILILIFNLNNVCHDDVLVHLPVVLVSGEAQGGGHQLARGEVAQGGVAEQRCRVLVGVFRARLLQHDVALVEYARFRLLALYLECLSARRNLVDSCFHKFVV